MTSGQQLLSTGSHRAVLELSTGDDFETNESDGDATREQQQFLIVVQCAIYVGVLNVNSRFMTGPSVNVVLWISLMLL